MLQEHADGHATVILFLFLRDGNPVESMQIVDDSRVRGMYFQSRESDEGRFLLLTGVTRVLEI